MKYAKNTKKKILLHVPKTGMTIPATLICGRETGKTITVSAGVHSREYIGILVQAPSCLCAHLARLPSCLSVCSCFRQIRMQFPTCL